MCACARFVCLPRSLPANFKEQAGRSQGFHNHVRDPKEAQGAMYSALKTGIAIAYADNLKVQRGFKYFTNQPRNFQNIKVTRKVRKRQYRNPLFGHIGG